MSEQNAHVTISLAPSVRGDRLIESVKRAVANDEPIYRSQFVSQRGFDNGEVFLIGQRSGYPHKHLIVAASLASYDGIRPTGVYGSIVVMGYSWGGTLTPATSNAAKMQAESVRKFAGLLLAILPGTINQPTVVTTWPQDVQVCGQCEQVVTWHDNEAYCPSHEKVQLLRTVSVEPVRLRHGGW